MHDPKDPVPTDAFDRPADDVRPDDPLQVPGQHVALPPLLRRGSDTQPANDSYKAFAVNQPSDKELRVRWTRQIGAALVDWDNLTERELIWSEGRLHKLASLLRERYAMTHEEAEKQVVAFFERHRH